VTVGYTMDTVYLRWLPSPIQMDSSVGLLGFILTDTVLHDCRQNYSTG